MSNPGVLLLIIFFLTYLSSISVLAWKPLSHSLLSDDLRSLSGCISLSTSYTSGSKVDDHNSLTNFTVRRNFLAMSTRIGSSRYYLIPPQLTYVLSNKHLREVQIRFSMYSWYLKAKFPSNKGMISKKCGSNMLFMRPNQSWESTAA